MKGDNMDPLKLDHPSDFWALMEAVKKSSNEGETSVALKLQGPPDSHLINHMREKGFGVEGYYTGLGAEKEHWLSIYW